MEEFLFLIKLKRIIERQVFLLNFKYFKSLAFSKTKPDLFIYSLRNIMDQIRKDEPIKKDRGLGFKRFDSISGDPRITVITTGGTIVQQFDKKQGGYVPKTSGLELIKSINSKINTEKIDLVEFAMIDSRAVDTKFLYELSALVNAKINDDRIDAVVIIHG